MVDDIEDNIYQIKIVANVITHSRVVGESAF
jgi:hypothetical protein